MDLWDTVQSLNNKYGNPGADFSTEIADFEKNILEQKMMIEKAVNAEISSIPKVTAILNQVDLSEIIAKAESAME
ncbi:MAG: hypothetical protein JEZ04_16830 [Spirochaetales bacterium]|nr:hypothetical protein [Spirochaetales bacterium]